MSSRTPDDAEGRPTGLGVTFRFGPRAPVLVEREGPMRRPEKVADILRSPRLRLLHGGLDGIPVPDVPAAPVDEPPG